MILPTESHTTSVSPKPVSALVVMAPGRLQAGLLALLDSLPGLQTVYHADDIAAAGGALTRAAPQLLILDWDLWNPEAEALLRAARAQAPHLYCLSLVGGESQQAAAWKAGAEAVLVKGFSVRDLEAVVRRCAALHPAPGAGTAGLPETDSGSQTAGAPAAGG
jgi:DNA-binding response OmpR family regulator